MNLRYKRIAVKIGSNVLTRSDGTLDVTRISSLVDQIVQLWSLGVEVIVVSSGAVASGKSEVTPSKKIDAVSARQLFSAIGQTKLMNCYFELFRNYGIVCGQVLTAKESFATRRHYLNQKNCIQVMLDNKVVPIVNENDTISVTELMFTDNDELSGLMAAMMDVDALIILSNVDGIYTGSPSDPDSELIEEITIQTGDLSHYIQTSQSNFGRGGMITKCNTARKVAQEGVAVYIANGKRESVLIKLLDMEQSVPNTHFIAAEKATSGIKKWVAHSNHFSKGELHISQGAYDALTSEQATSLLPIGVVRVEGAFEKDDLVDVVYEGKVIGIGKCNDDHRTAAQMIGQKGGKPIIHYDYLYIE